jgi:oligopeptide/dipeptide ABC transporter ATP-binding protein
VRDVFYDPRHPYTLGLLKSSPRLDEERTEGLVTIQGQPPNLQNLPPGCAFSDRCPVSEARCRSDLPLLRGIGGGRKIACHRESPQ